MPAVA